MRSLSTPPTIHAFPSQAPKSSSAARVEPAFLPQTPCCSAQILSPLSSNVTPYSPPDHLLFYRAQPRTSSRRLGKAAPRGRVAAAVCSSCTSSCYGCVFVSRRVEELHCMSSVSPKRGSTMAGGPETSSEIGGAAMAELKRTNYKNI
jgi:hypothetical protein